MIDKVAGAAVQGANEVAKSPKAESFGKLMKPKPGAPQRGQDPALQQAQSAQKAEKLGAAPAKAPAQKVAQAAQVQTAPVSQKPEAASLINEVSAAQQKLDGLLKMAESGRTFSPAELLAFQAHAYRASQELDLAGKVVEKATGGVKQTLNTQV